MVSGSTMDPDAFHVDPQHFFLSNEQEIKKRVNLDELVPVLYKKQLLTHDEREELLYVHHLPAKRKTRLVEIMASKEDRAPRLYIECLRETNSQSSHSELATILEKWLQSQMAVSMPQAHEVAALTTANPPPYPKPSNPSAPPSSHAPTHSPCTSSALGESSFMPPNHPSRPTCGVPSAIDSLEQLQRGSPEFANIIFGIASELEHRKVVFESVQEALLAQLELDAIPIQLPSDVMDFPSLILHLRRLKMCHESDVDLLCKLLETLEHVDLRDRVKAYVDRLASTDVMQHRYQQSRPSHQHFVAFTFHNVPSLSLGEAYEIKHFISDLLHIPQHTFTLVGSEEGSIGLAWQIPVQFLKHVQSSLSEDKDVRAFLISSEYHLVSIELEAKEGSEREVAFTVPADHFSKEHVGMTACAGTSACDPYYVSSQEDAVSSTVDEFSSSIDSELSKYCVLC